MCYFSLSGGDDLPTRTCASRRTSCTRPRKRRRKHKKKRLVQSPNSYFMDAKCPGCYKITTVFSHTQTVVLCVDCSTVLCQPTGRKSKAPRRMLLQIEAALNAP
uniref:40S ribosomal protein S27 n=1 Tax=Felis catus TaxID=9685 RepID=A0ABI7WU46_FELCA